ncbi:MAG: LacI family DNA-binding transcriptional regulator [Proteobacteria bacterium]|nr:LacI family DNA-binding transcriptional regulator [Pseudomonadota bacterium]MBI3496251.1 LacI family DNA-binding transcriptional regulator [Pseudomonadota bacterium]
MSALRALASSLGLSPTTVSRALDGYGDVAAKTRQRVHLAADAAGYRPNAAARRLRRGAPEMVSLVLPTEPGHFNEPLYIELLAAMGGHLAGQGFDLTLIAAPPGPDEIKTYRRLVEGRRADGIVVVRTRRQDPRIDYLGRIGFPFVVMGRTEMPLPYAFVDGDGELAFLEATQRLLRLGHRRIAHIAAPAAFTFAHLRRRGYERAMRQAGLAPVIAEATADERGGLAGARDILGAREPPTALLCATDLMAFGALKAARERGLAVPADLSVIGHDNIPMSAYSDPPLTTMELPIEATGRRLAEMILARIGGAGPEGMQEILAVRPTERGSTARPRD